MGRRAASPRGAPAGEGRGGGARRSCRARRDSRPCGCSCGARPRSALRSSRSRSSARSSGSRWHPPGSRAGTSSWRWSREADEHDVAGAPGRGLEGAAAAVGRCAPWQRLADEAQRKRQPRGVPGRPDARLGERSPRAADRAAHRGRALPGVEGARRLRLRCVAGARSRDRARLAGQMPAREPVGRSWGWHIAPAEPGGHARTQRREPSDPTGTTQSDSP